jgi:hypothetical protein
VNTKQVSFAKAFCGSLTERRYMAITIHTTMRQLEPRGQTGRFLIFI